MEIPNHRLSYLFDQIGLASTPSAIEAFIESHQLATGERLEDAPFWNASQFQFIQEARYEDAVWVLLVDEFDALLHKKNMPR